MEGGRVTLTGLDLKGGAQCIRDVRVVCVYVCMCACVRACFLVALKLQTFF